MGRVKQPKVKLPGNKELSWVSRDRLEKKVTKLHRAIVKEKHPKLDQGRWQGWWATYRVVYDRDKHTAYIIYFEHREFRKNKTRARTFDSRRGPTDGHFLTVLEYLEPKPCIYMEWLEYNFDEYRSCARDGLRVLGAFDFDPLKAIEFYTRECKRCYGSVSPKQYELPAEPRHPEVKLRRFDIA